VRDDAPDEDDAGRVFGDGRRDGSDVRVDCGGEAAVDAGVVEELIIGPDETETVLTEGVNRRLLGGGEGQRKGLGCAWVSPWRREGAG
jgi:hypothetical protein